MLQRVKAWLKPAGCAGVIILLASCASDDGRTRLSVAEISARLTAPAGRSQVGHDCAAFAKAVNRYVRMGRGAAVVELRSRAEKADADLLGDDGIQVARLCQVLFSAGHTALRGPGFGDPMLPSHDMKGEKWPIFPMVRGGDTYFALASGYILSGQAEPCGDYVDYCIRNGKFRSTALKVPTRAQSTRDLEALRQSPQWQAIRWNYRDPERGDFHFKGSEFHVLMNMAKQLPRN